MAYPVLLPGNSWFNSTTMSRPDFKTIRIVNRIEDYTPPEGVTTSETWSANVVTDEFPENSITCYVFGDELIVAGNGLGKIAANSDSSYLFSASVTSYDNIQTFMNVTHITGLDVLDMLSATTLERAFAYMGSLQSLDGVGSWETDNVTSMAYMFGISSKALPDGTAHVPIKSLDISGWKFDEVTNTRNMFLGCTELEELDVSQWRMSKLSDLKSMFQECKSLKALDIKDWGVIKATDMGGAFGRCENIKELDFSSWNNSNVTNEKVRGALGDTLRLEKLTISSDFKFGTGGHPNDPSSEYIEGADGKWHTLRGESYTAANMPGNRAITYYASPLLVEKVLDTPVLIPGRMARNISTAIREKTGGQDDLKPADYEAAIRSI